MKSGYSVGDFAGYGISIGSIIGVIVGVVLCNPGAGLFSGMILGTVAGILIGGRVLAKVELNSNKKDQNSPIVNK